MRFLPFLAALVAIGATSVALTAKTKTVPSNFAKSELEKSLKTEPIAISIDDLVLPIENLNEFEESVIPPAISNLNGKRVRLIGKIKLPEPSETCGVIFFGDTRRKPKEIFDDGIFPQHSIRLTFNQTQAKVDQFAGAIVEIQGRLVIDTKYWNGILVQVYRIEDATIDFGTQQEGFQNSRDVMHIELMMMIMC